MHLAYLTLLAHLMCTLSWATPHYLDDCKHERDDYSSLSIRRNSRLPFKRIVAFGDDFTDNGSGSFAHGITGNPKTGAGKHMWGYNTFTVFEPRISGVQSRARETDVANTVFEDGYVAVTYLARKLKIPVTYDYAWGSAGGAQVIGSVCDNAAIRKNKRSGHAKYNGKLVPDALQQVANYTQSGVFTHDIAQTLHFFWTGNNDMIASLGWAGRFTLCILDTLCLPGQQKFITKLLGCFRSSLTSLVKAGAYHIIVPNVYPRQLSPWTTMWITNTLGLIGNFGSVVDEFNTQLSELVNDINSEHGTNIMLYDVNSFIQESLNNPRMVHGSAYRNTCTDSCNIQARQGISNWDLYWNHTVIHKKPDLFYWMTEIMPSTTVHRSIAHDMKQFLLSQRY